MKSRPVLSSKNCGNSSPPAMNSGHFSPPSASRTEKSLGITSVHLRALCFNIHADRCLSASMAECWGTFLIRNECKKHTLNWIYLLSCSMRAFVTSSSYSSVVCDCNFWMSAKELWLKALVTGSGHALMGMFCISLWCSL